ncbi:hypothetical protein NDU88_007200 [Pleurodeles waltl]|uniref:Uncharacterized protein n=1 Tax=Pleurodeles waltl TaxID=8319 RepID=A0AAV7QJY8_PLEWA|nr:hypothetical protein NDU88_007200 [Pleurodeles waltl]
MVATINVNPILISDDSESEWHWPTPPPSSMGPIHTRLDSIPYTYGFEYEEGLEGSLDPYEYQDDPNMDWAQELGEASGLDTSPDAGMLSPPTTAEGATYSTVVSRAAEVLGLELPTVQVRSNLLKEVLQPRASTSESLLPFNEALTDVLLSTRSRPNTGASVNRTIARRHRPVPNDSKFLFQHPTPESLVIQASSSSGAFPSTPLDRESKRLDQFGKKMFSSSSLALRSVNTTCLLDCYTHYLWDRFVQVLSQIPEEAHAIIFQAVTDGKDAGKFTIRCGVDTTISLGRSVATTVALRSHA